jgi:hypothetical protein
MSRSSSIVVPAGRGGVSAGVPGVEVTSDTRGRGQ